MSTEQTRYEFGPLEARGLIAGLRAGQVAAVAAGLVTAVLVVRVHGSTRGWAVALAITGLAAAVAFAPVGGRALDQWLPVAYRWARRRLRGEHRYRSMTPLLGLDSDGQATPRPPSTVAGVRLFGHEVAGGGQVGIIHDRRHGSYAAVLAVRGYRFALVDGDEKARRLAAWGGVLAALGQADSPVHRLQWVQRTVPDDGDEMGRYLASAVRVDADHPSLASYLELVDQAGPATQEQETLLVVAISAAKGRKAIKDAGGGDQGAATVLLDEVRHLQQQLIGAEIIVDGALTPRMVARSLRTAFDPDARVELARRAASSPDRQPGTTLGNAWPLATQASWRSYRSEGAWHATLWIAQWPRVPVGPDFLAPLLLHEQTMHTVSLTMSPVPPDKARRQAERSVVATLADDELRARAGFLATARRRRQGEAARRREAELADGHSDYRMAGYVTVTVPDGDGAQAQLDKACRRVAAAASKSGLEVRRLFGEQDSAFTWTLPLGRGLPGSGLS